MTNEYCSLREFFIAELAFTSIKSSGAHTFLAPLELWQSNHNRTDQPLLIRVNTAPGGRDLEVTILLANVPMAKLSVDDAYRMKPQMINHLVNHGRIMLVMLHEERAKVAALVREMLGTVRVAEVNA